MLDYIVCHNCGADLLDTICRYCGSDNEVLFVTREELNKLLKQNLFVDMGLGFPSYYCGKKVVLRRSY